MRKTISVMTALLMAVAFGATFVACHDTPGTWGHHSGSDLPNYNPGGSSGGSSSSSSSGSSGSGSASGSGATVTPPTAVAGVQEESPSALAGKTLKAFDPSNAQVFEATFDSTGAAGIFTDGEGSGTFTYDGHMMKFSNGHDQRILNVGGTYYIAFGKMVKADGTSGFVGKWKMDWDNNAEKPIVFEADGKISSWDDGATGTWVADSDGVVTVTLTGGSGDREEWWLYSGDALYNKRFTATLS